MQISKTRTVAVYAVHLPQPALSHSGFAVARDTALASLVAAIKAEPAPQLIVVGDLDLATTDRGMQDLLGGGPAWCRRRRRPEAASASPGPRASR